MNIKPYVGITDFTDSIQIERMLRVLKENRQLHSNRKLHVGIMISYKTLNDEETKWARVFPKKETISDIFCLADEDLYNCLHYADYDKRTQHSDLQRAIEFAGKNVNAIQLDMVWPSPALIEKGIIWTRKQLEIILQVSKNAIEEIGGSPADIAKKIDSYNGLVSHILLDMSMGRGIGMDPSLLLSYAKAIANRHPNLGLVFAGGLGPKTIDLIRPIASVFPNMSIDAQGQLRPSGDALMPVEWSMAEEYLIKSLKILK